MTISPLSRRPTPSLFSLTPTSQLDRISSGKRISRAADDPAGLAVAQNSDAAVVSLSTGARNGTLGVSSLRLVDAALGQTTEIGERLQELSIQSQNGTYSKEQREALNKEYQALVSEITRIADTTQFGGRKLLSGERTEFQVGAGGDGVLAFEGVDLRELSKNLEGSSLTSQAGAGRALELIGQTLESISQARGNVAAVSARVEDAVSVNLSGAVANEAARARIEDVDIAEELSLKIAGDVRNGARTAVSAQANQDSYRALELLKA